MRTVTRQPDDPSVTCLRRHVWGRITLCEGFWRAIERKYLVQFEYSGIHRDYRSRALPLELRAVEVVPGAGFEPAAIPLCKRGGFDHSHHPGIQTGARSWDQTSGLDLRTIALSSTELSAQFMGPSAGLQPACASSGLEAVLTWNSADLELPAGLEPACFDLEDRCLIPSATGAMVGRQRIELCSTS